MKIKTLSIHFVILAILTYSCENLEFRKDLIGNWELKYAGGGEYPTEIVTQFTFLKIKTKNSFSVYNYDTLKANSTYYIISPDHQHNGIMESFHLRFSGKSNINQKLNFPFDRNLDVRFESSDTLFLYENLDDGLEYCFVKSGK